MTILNRHHNQRAGENAKTNSTRETGETMIFRLSDSRGVAREISCDSPAMRRGYGVCLDIACTMLYFVFAVKIVHD
jgi:hypothetical protein